MSVVASDGDSMSRPPQNLNLIDYAMAEAERVFIGVRFLLREKLKERRRSNAFCFLSRPMKPMGI
jgi:hypothetical protein